MAVTEWKNPSKNQQEVFQWWRNKERKYDGIICDGAIRSGKTLCMGISFVEWAFECFDQNNFALCGKTLNALKRNVVIDLVDNMRVSGYDVKENSSQHFLDISKEGRKNRFYLFGGDNERSASKVQGATLAGVLFDEVALMPQSFVNQTVARCSREGSTFWFNCNPEHPYHWFYLEWILKREEKNLLYLHFTMDDNPSLSDEMKERYRKLYSGPFYERFVLGEWRSTQGAVYVGFSEEKHCFSEWVEGEKYYVSCDYGIQNPFSMGLYTIKEGQVYRLKEWYYCGREEGIAMTDEEYYEKLLAFTEGVAIEAVVVDPSASSFISLIRKKGLFHAVPAKNNVISGIHLVADLLRAHKLFIHRDCKNCLREFYLYKWSENKGDKPHKENDHTMDELRYFVATVVDSDPPQENFFVLSSQRKRRRG